MAKTKNAKKILYFISSVLLIIILALLVFTKSPLLDGLENTLGGVKSVEQEYPFTAYFIDVGQGDCTLIICDDQTMLVDAGENGAEEEIIEFLHSQGIDKLDYILMSHPHSDHIGGIPEIIENFETNTLVMSPISDENKIEAKATYEKIIENTQNYNIAIEFVKSGDCFNLGNAKIEILGPITNDSEDLNGLSIVLKITYGTNTFLLTGDADIEEEKAILDRGLSVKADLLKVGHHGSAYSTSEEFLSAVEPEYAVISVGLNNSYGHPKASTLTKIREYTSNIYRTDYCGTIKATSDGKTITVTY